jgi:hypothetical protein
MNTERFEFKEKNTKPTKEKRVMPYKKKIQKSHELENHALVTLRQS